MKNRTLLIVLLVLLAAYGLIQLLTEGREASFRTSLLEVDTSEISKLVIDPKGKPASFELERTGRQWIARRGEVEAQVGPDKMDRLFSSISNLRTQSVAAKSEDQWPKYELGEAEAHKVEVYAEGSKQAGLYFGKMDFNQQQRKATTYARVEGEPEVYALDGFQTMGLVQGFDNYRNRTVIKMKPGMEVTQFEYQRPNGAVSFQRTPEGWQSGGQMLDSMKVENYLNVLRNLKADAFADAFDPALAAQWPKEQLQLSGNNILQPFELTVYRDTSAEQPFIVHSSYNPDAYFRSDSAGLYSKLFKPVEELR